MCLCFAPARGRCHEVWNIQGLPNSLLLLISNAIYRQGERRDCKPVYLAVFRADSLMCGDRREPAVPGSPFVSDAKPYGVIWSAPAM
jgi:hypothetical protein